MFNGILNQLENSEKPVVNLLYNHDGVKVIAIAFKEGMLLKEHKTNLPAKLIIIKGNVIYREESMQVSLKALDEMHISVEVLHSVEAMEESLCLLLQGQKL